MSIQISPKAVYTKLQDNDTIMSSSQQSYAFNFHHGYFSDEYNRILLVRGVNLGGSSKLPTGYTHSDEYLASQSVDDFYNTAKTVSFVNRPFPLDEADKHFMALKRWGLTFLRLIITWEAIEHEGPGQYDQEYIEYIRQLISKAAKYGLLFYIDPHQDVWSRWTGGDGAPMWTLEAIGLEPRHFEVTKAALCIETSGLSSVLGYKKMIWPTNYLKFACATMFTLFWGGKKYAPSCFVDGMQVQEYLQSHYINAMAELAKELQGLDNVIGFGTMNEPSSGYIGVRDLSLSFTFDGKPDLLRSGLVSTPFQGMALADGHPQSLKLWSMGIKQFILNRPEKTVHVDPKGVRAWKANAQCIWEREGVWGISSTTNMPELKKPDYFSNANFGEDHYLPFAIAYTNAIRKHLPKALIFIEMPPEALSPWKFPTITSDILPGAVNASHWYDGVTLGTGTYRKGFTVDVKTKKLVLGAKNVKKCHVDQLHEIRTWGENEMHGSPTLIGECGIPFNLNGDEAYKTGIYTDQIAALNHTISCLEENLLNYTLWTFASDNTNATGDQWNREDLSIISRPGEKEEKPQKFERSRDPRDVNARALSAFARPHAMKIAGLPQRSRFIIEEKKYELVFTSTAGHINTIDARTSEVYIPHVHYPKGYTIEVTNGDYEIAENDGWDLIKYTINMTPESTTPKSYSLTVESNDEVFLKYLRKRKQMAICSKALLAVGAVAVVGISVYILGRH